LIEAAYNDYSSETSRKPEGVINFEDWCERWKLQSPQFQFWYLVLNIELTILTLIEANFTLNREALPVLPYPTSLPTVMFTMHLLIHLRCMMSIEQQHPQLAREFHNVHKSGRKFSALAIDQAHEHNNTVVKGDGGAISLTEDPSALRRWMVPGPEVSHLVVEYEAVSGTKDAMKTSSHHEQTEATQRTFFENVNILPSCTSKTFDDYIREDVLPKLESYCTKYKRTDIMFDVYWQSSLKSEARSKQGKGIRRRVTGTSKTPTNWWSFLHDDNNKTELSYFLADKIAEIRTTNTVIVTKGENVISNQMICLEDMAPCTHEEADTRIFIHARHATMEGNKVLMIDANDTGVVVIAISVLSSLKELGLEKMWIAFGQWIPINDIVSTIGHVKASGIPFFHAFSGCDVSAFHGKGKKSAW
uniref:Uncharacterized protein n=1 Tax=Latimeria chalumnae TaxID=7897 RepID=H3AU70_LATCH